MPHLRPLARIPIPALIVLLAMPALAGAKKTAGVLLRPTVDEAAGQLAKSLVSAGLSQAGYEVIALADDLDLDEARTATPPADLLVELDLVTEASPKDPSQRGHVLAIRISEFGSKRLLAAKVVRSGIFAGEDPEASLAAIRSAATAGRADVLAQLKAYERHHAAEGNSYSIQFINPPKGANRVVHHRLAQMCSRTKLRADSETSLVYRASCKPALEQVRQGLEEAIRTKWKKAVFQVQPLGQGGLMFVFTPPAK